jgi:hypothetical protein
MVMTLRDSPEAVSYSQFEVWARRGIRVNTEFSETSGPKSINGWASAST